jgi:endonuclease-3 related protein
VYGPQHWWPADTPWEVIAGAILTQSAAWSNVEKAMANLRAAGVTTCAAVHAADQAELANLVHPSGYYNAKARKLKAFAGHVAQRHGGDLDRMLAQPAETLRPELLGIHGVGPETADSILLYAAGRPAFVIDSYTRRIAVRLGLALANATYDQLQALFTSQLSSDATLFNEFHALLVVLGKIACRKRPACDVCPLAAGYCPSASAGPAAAR